VLGFTQEFMSLRFDEAKATQAAALFLRLRGGCMSYLRLIKLLYLTDRAALLRWGIPVTTDHYVSMDHGPVVSRTYDLILEDMPKPGWAEYISPPPLGEYEVRLRKEAPTDRLSRAEEQLIREVFDQYGQRSRWQLVDYVHTLPEWKNPHGSSIPIPIREILKAGGEDEDEIRAVLRELNGIAAAEETLSIP
jgi:uncharacterized phage-associated protein